MNFGAEAGAALPLRACLLYEKRCWRILAPRWAYQPLSGEGAARNGGRWNPKGVPALYLSESIDTAFAEYQQTLYVRPGTFCAYRLLVAGVVDLCDPTVLVELGVNEETLPCAWREIALIRKDTPPTWTLASKLFAAGASGVRVPSAQFNGGINIVLWRWNDAPERQVEVLDPIGDLPKDQRSWSP
ncbi:RES family NAD+ phosphorylase [Gloeobacter violaceus]|uniref:Glr2725 protein n=1 Tax=Gloeobacter violaceus (strain ATCC 29082 / PCC 7421) TaxID=251221 RepID=Q7NH12_GLOVI|nr:RES domain-containing protein [Gloeobacter violaceus]BAC90666.1 glr2725 [Gloeobacter violaceus PCC 7421]